MSSRRRRNLSKGRALAAVVREELSELRQSLRLYKRIIPYVRMQWRLLAATGSLMLVGTLILLARPWPLQIIVDSVLGSKPTPAWFDNLFGPRSGRALLATAVLLMVTTVLMGQAIALGQEYFSQVLGQRMVTALRCDLYTRLQRLSLTFHDEGSVGDLIYRVTQDAAALQDVVTYGFVPLVVQLITAAAIGAAIFALDVRLGFVALVLAPILIVWSIWSSERVKRRSRSLASAESNLYTTASEVLGSIRAVKSFVNEDVEAERFASQAVSSQDAYVRVMTFSAFGNLVTTSIVELGTAAIIFIGGLAALNGTITTGRLLVFVAYLQSLYGPIMQLAASAVVVQRSGASIERVVQIFDQQDETERGGRQLDRVHGHVSLYDVHFSYNGRDPAINGLSLDIEPGEMVAFVGSSGAGKTTLISLLLQFYLPSQGHIRLDGVDVSELDVRWLRRQIALVLQEPIIFSCSFGENIAYGKPDATQADIMAAAMAAGLHEFITSLPEGYSTKVGERGVRMSGGQRQRLSIARAFLKDAPILILDEPTSNLDATTERQIFESIKTLASGRTTLVIAHRLATVQRADRIVVLDKGAVVEQGTHSELLTRDGAYRRLYNDQIMPGLQEVAVRPTKLPPWPEQLQPLRVSQNRG